MGDLINKDEYQKVKIVNGEKTSLGTLYEMNQAAMLKEPFLTKQALIDKAKEIAKDMSEGYYMLLCHEIRYYTIFKVNETVDKTDLAFAIRDCLKNAGRVYSIDKQEDGAWEIWISAYDLEGSKPYPHAFYLFNYSNGIVEV